MADGAQVVGRAFRVHDPAAGRHPVDRAGLDALHAAEAVAVDHRTLEQVGDGGEPDVRVRPDVVIGTRLHVDRAEMIEEQEWADALTTRGREHPAHDESTAEVVQFSVDRVHGMQSTDGDALEISVKSWAGRD